MADDLTLTDNSYFPLYKRAVQLEQRLQDRNEEISQLRMVGKNESVKIRGGRLTLNIEFYYHHPIMENREHLNILEESRFLKSCDLSKKTTKNLHNFRRKQNSRPSFKPMKTRSSTWT